MRTSVRTLFFSMAFCVGTLGCSVLPKSPTHVIYRLPPSALTPAPGPAMDISLRLERPSTSDVLRSPRIAVIPEGNRFSVYSGARWAAPVPALWRNHLLDAFHNDGRIRWLSSDTEGARADWELGGMLRAFQTEYRAGEPHVVLQFDARLIATGSRHIAASRRFELIKPVGSEKIPQVVDAFGRAADTLARQLIDWTVDELR